MKKILSILFAGLVIISSVNLTIATHYCRNTFEGFKISVSGERAACGMEASIPAYSTEKSFSHNCCKDKVASYLVIDNYSPASFHFIKSNPNNFISLFASESCISESLANSKWQIAHTPPGEFLPYKVELASICLLRI